jgi:hypothetical protein
MGRNPKCGLPPGPKPVRYSNIDESGFEMSEYALILCSKPKSMRRLFLFAVLISALSAKAQSLLPLGSAGYAEALPLGNHYGSLDFPSDKKWFLTRYTALSAGYDFLGGYNASFLALPATLQLNRRLNNNWYAFAGLTAAPAYVNFNQSFLSANRNKFYPNTGFPQYNGLGGYAGATLGFMYVNDARTFSISGSFSVERSSFPAFPVESTGSSKRSGLGSSKN